MKTKIRTYDEWFDEFKPIKNSITKYQGDHNYAFETYGDEYEFVKAQPERNVWTEVDGEGGCYIVSGWHFVNRIQYYVTEKPFGENEDYEIPTCLYKDCDCVDDEGEAREDCGDCEGSGAMNIWIDSRVDLVEIYGESVLND